MFTFEKFIPGQSVGTDSLVIDRALFDDWVALFPDDAEIWPLMPPGMAAPVVLRSYMKLTAPRPPGNVHAGQRFEMHRLPRIGDTAVTELVCPFLRSMIERERDPKVRQAYQLRLQALERVHQIEEAVAEFRQRYQRLPKRIEELVALGLLPDLPADPYGGTFFLDASGRVRSSSNFSKIRQ